ncbi:hypothetical protein [Desulfobacula sp.]|uniref:hypothetical protein n=1 Tax=Desulfobacula sp. TaxID=2593537 RepID=UPI002714E1F2|nr:hypothetical protein [Desulfobacula sp.]
MKKRLLTLMAIVAALGMVFMAGPVMAAESDTATQSTNLTVDEIAVIDVTGGGSVPALNITAPATGGLAPQDASDATTYAQYTSVVADSVTRSITAQMSVAAPAGTQLTLTATPASGMGTTGGEKILNHTTAETIVTAIGSCATGTGATYGSLLTYSLDVTDVTALVAGANATPTITFTLTEAN